MVLARNPGASDEELWRALIVQNVISQLVNLRTHPAVAVRLATGELQIHGWLYDIPSGDVQVWDEPGSQWVGAAEMAGRFD